MPRFKSFQHPERTALFRLFETFPAERAKFEQYLHTVLDDQVGRRLLKHPIFSGMPSQCLKRVTLLLERKVSHPQSLIFEEGEVGSSMVVFNVGKADILFRGTQVSMLWAGKSFGAAQMMGVVQHYHATVRTKTMCGWDDLLFFQWFSTEVKTEFVVLFHLQDPRLSISSRLLQQVKQCKTPCVKLCQNVQHTGLLYSAIASDIVSSWMPELWLCWFRFRWQNLIWPRYRLTMVRQWEGIIDYEYMMCCFCRDHVPRSRFDADTATLQFTDLARTETTMDWYLEAKSEDGISAGKWWGANGGNDGKFVCNGMDSVQYEIIWM